MDSQREAKRSPVPNTKFKALVLLPRRMDSVGGGGGVSERACARVLVCAQLRYLTNHRIKLRAEVTKREAAQGGGRTARHLYSSTALRGVFLLPVCFGGGF